METNPYEPTTTTQDPQPTTGQFPWALLLGSLYPLVSLLLLHFLWLMTWASLGHPPRLYRDTPRFVGAQALMHLTAVLLLLSPMAAFLSLLLVLMIGSGSRVSGAVRFARISLLVGIWTCAFVYIRMDPLGVVDWFMD